MSSTLEAAVKHAGEALGMISEALKDPELRIELLAALGWKVPAEVTEVDLGGLDVGTVLDKLATLIGSSDADQDNADLMLQRALEVAKAIADFVSALRSAATALSSLPEPFRTATNIENEFVPRLLQFLLARHIQRRDAVVFNVLKLAGVIEVVRFQPAEFQTAHNRFTFRLDRIVSLISPTRSWAKDVYGWGTTTPDLQGLLVNLADVFQHLGGRAGFGTLDQATEEMLLGRPVPEASSAPMPFIATRLIRSIRPETLEAGISLFGARASTPTSADAGLALTPFVTGTSTLEFPLGLSEQDDWRLVFSATADSLTGGLVLFIRPGGNLDIQENLFDPDNRGPSGAASVSVAIKGRRPTGSIPLLSFGGATLQATGVSLAIGAQTNGGVREVFGELKFDGGRLSVEKGGDGFISKLLGEAGIESAFDLAILYSPSRGLRFGGSGTLETTLQLNIEIGPLTISSVRLGVGTDGDVLTAEASATFTASIGPVVASVERLGIGAGLRFADGNLGPVDLSLRVKPPNGIGIFIDAGSVAGGGFIRFEPDAGRYSGALDLRIYDIHVKAFGLIETNVPGVPFSFIIVISAEFEPIQLGYGFMLLGIGGLIGINRSIKHDAIADAVSNGRLDHVLFPDDLIGNAPSIIKDLGELFPATAGSYAFGPMAKLTWLFLVNGTLGLLFEWPSKKVVIIGTVRAALPRQDNAIVKLKMDVAGELDFPGKHFELRASIDPEGSSAGGYKLSGDMAMLLDWGERPDFALSVGGFNPAYAPPPKFPHLRRMAIELGIEGNPRMTVQGYMALTSNTAQVGAKLDAEWHKYGADVRGYLGFDALIVFSPFHFTATLAGGVHVDFVGVGFDLSISATLSGPSPWRLDGEICVGVWPFEACPDFHIQLTGEEAKATLIPLDPWLGSPTNVPAKDQDAPGLYPAILDLRNWRGVLEAGDFTGVTYLETGATDQKVDPVGTATFMQKAVPLDYDITRFADTTPSRKGELKIQFVAVGGQLAEIKPKGDWFAPGRYHEMTETQKLESSAFEFLNAGVTITSASVRIGTVATKTISYQSFLMAEDGSTTDLGTGATPTPTQLTGMATATFAARPAVRTLGGVRFTDFTLPPKLTHDLVTYRVVTKSTLTNAPGLSTTLTRTQAAWALAGIVGPALSTKQVYQIISNPQLAAA